ncbi:DIL-domain-containing protein [Dacryopinax primogenitus]|uniref:DIL-domain-containing protein n=1 Tax=Dacryopinax primogenitus (strain DJM 731) TaxID=1858805 RepID=M5FXA8_DACPD|nr:DIL-domain-containing protein [Dacryopinax primogenitus]EJU01084.1 DIL-domain-containing protein [Dacryopinax primogenitus]
MSVSSIISVSPSVSSLRFEPDLAPLQPKPVDLLPLLGDPDHLSVSQKRALASHALRHALLFADIALLIFLLNDPTAKPSLDLTIADEDGRGVLTIAMMGFGTEDAEREMDREECCRMLLVAGASIEKGDNAGWTPFHYAALMAPPTLITYMLQHCTSHGLRTEDLLNARTNRNGLTPLDVISAHTPLPGREGIILMLEDAMGVGAMKERMKREQREAERRRSEEKKEWLEERRKCLMTWGLGGWGEDDEEDELDGDEDMMMWDSDSDEEDVLSPPSSWESMLAFSLPSLQGFLMHLIDQQKPTLNPVSRRSLPAHVLWLCGRFAIAQADEDWFDEVLLGGLSRIEDIILNTNDVPILAFWAFNVTLLMYLLRTDKLVSGWADDFEHVGVALELLDYIYNGIVRSVEHRMAPLIDSTMLDFTPLGPDQGFDLPQYEGEWTFLKGVRDTLRLKKPASANNSPSSKPGTPKQAVPPPLPPKDPPRPPPKSSSITDIAAQAGGNIARASAEPKVFAELRKAVSHSRPRTPPGPGNFSPSSKDEPDIDSPRTLITLFSSLLRVLRLYGLNPAYIIQIFSQIFVWMHADMFNKVISRSKYLCRSRALQIRMNISTLEDWTSREGLPRSLVSKHFEPLSQLLQWLQCCSQIDQFSDLIATVQTLRRINPLQMRKAVRDYRYEVGESHMNEECNQYLQQMQRDWERRRLRIGVESMRKDMEARERERSDGGSSEAGFIPGLVETGQFSATDEQAEMRRAQEAIDALFDGETTMADWVPPQAPMAVGELQNATYILHVFWPTGVRHLMAEPGDSWNPSFTSPTSAFLTVPGRPTSAASMASIVSTRSSKQMEWKRRSARALRDTWTLLPQWIDALSPGVFWEDYRGNKYVKAAALDSEEEEENEVEQVEFDLLQERDSTLADLNKGLRLHTLREGLPEEDDEEEAVPEMLQGKTRSSGESSLLTPQPSDPPSIPPVIEPPPGEDAFHTPPASPLPEEPEEDKVELLRTTSVHSKVTIRRKLRRKRRDGSDITVKPDRKTSGTFGG